jgi:tetratricopeptide (TPR) repeat protein
VGHAAGVAGENRFDVSKAQIIRKKALDHVRDQDWPNAIKEYKRLVELDQSNPNLHNELADLYLKTSQKNEAYDAFIRACDEYVRVGLHNNAVAVCKKLMRVLPARHEALAKLGFIRSRQGLAKEAESYYQQFLDKAAGNAFEPEAFQKIAKPIADDVADSAALLEQLAQALLAYLLKDDAADVFVKMVVVCEKNRDSAGVERARAEVEKLGQSAKLPAPGSGPDQNPRNVITEDNLWTKSHSEGERIQVDTTSRTTPTGSPAAPAPQPAGAAPGGPSERDLYLLRLARGSAAERPKAAPTAEAVPAAPDTVPAAGTATSTVAPLAQEAPVVESAPSTVATAAPVQEPPVAPPPPIAPAEPARPPQQQTFTQSPPGTNGSGLHVSALIGDDASGAGGEDYRSHYDLGMAYIEMDLFSEAIREYQLAAKSPQYQVKCLEMIGLCFIKQNQPQLAIRQLSKGLSLIGTETEDSLGIKYNLGLAHEMIGDLANARTYFEDVYVVDVTFRDVSEKVRRLASTT